MSLGGANVVFRRALDALERHHSAWLDRLCSLGGGSGPPWGALEIIGGARAPPKRYKVSPLLGQVKPNFKLVAWR